HGKSPFEIEKFELDAVVDETLKATPNQAYWFGWSMGGLISLAAALKAPDRIKGLITLAASARFTKDHDWPGVDPTSLENFASSLETDFQGTIKRFLSLQVHGAEHSRQTLRELRERIFAAGEPNHQALKDGLNVLKHADLRERVGMIEIPTLLLYGKLDSQAPAKLAQAMHTLMPEARIHIFPKAAHAPFISHGEEFLQQIRNFIDPIESTKGTQ
ncbi:MAG: pimeloyl-ACP methyl ester esterase BioH, partial [Gammaproteobacteria bacterium]|nr:pimeloyl-ACP methyl ester esterase BioH [Gammaproteobacteria bacterium]